MSISHHRTSSSCHAGGWVGEHSTDPAKGWKILCLVVYRPTFPSSFCVFKTYHSNHIYSDRIKNIELTVISDTHIHTHTHTHTHTRRDIEQQKQGRIWREREREREREN